MKLGKIAGLTSILMVLFAIGLVAVFRNDIFDWYQLRGYEPNAEVVSLADNTTMVDYSRKLFYINRPVIADGETFNEHCRGNEHSIVLGCYLSGQRGIYLLDVKDDRLRGIKEVTAAHEMLHSAYERLSSSEKERVNKLLEDAFKDVSNTRIIEAVESYRKQSADIVPNELHSILGSEVRSLPDELEKYYSKYFSNRLKVVGYSEQYEQAFVERRNSVRQYDAELADMKKDIESSGERLNQENADLMKLRDDLNRLRDEDVEAHNALVPDFNARVNKYNREYDELSAKIVKYNDTVQIRNDIVSEEAELIEAIDSRNVVPSQR